jgi:hypothetical protein
MHDIENSFTSPLKLYKSGKFYIVRTIIPTRLGKCTLKLFDEGESDITIDNIKDESKVITIWEIQGIKCSAKSFQIEIEIKQMMILAPSVIFEQCIIKGRSGYVKEQQITEPNTNIEQITEQITEPITEQITEQITEPITEQITEPITEQITYDKTIEEEDEPNKLLIIDGQTIDDILEIDIDIEDVDQNENIQLRNRNDVYYEMYMAAKQKAEEARNLAISSYLEVKRIKDLYLIQEIKVPE